MRGMRLLYRAALDPTDLDPAGIASSARPYLTRALLADPGRFLATTRGHEVFAELGEAPLRGAPGLEVASRRFATRYRPFHVAADLEHHDENDVVHVQHWMHPGGAPRGTMIAVHGFTMGRPRFDAPVLMVGSWFALGFDVALITLPFHGARAPRRSRYSGELFGSWHVGRLNEAVRQSIHDLRALVAWLVARGAGPVGVAGLSLGGYLAALLAGLEPGLSFAISIVPPVRLWDLPARLYSSGRGDPPVAPELLDRAYRGHSPLTYPLAVAPARTILIGARGDCVVPPWHVETLARHWDGARLIWLDGSHSAPFGRHRILDVVVAHLRTVGVLT